MQSNLRIGIVGGGPGGLTLARILATKGISSRVLELDEHPLSRPQGGTLDLHPESGQLAIAHAGLEDELRRIARHEDQEMRLYDKHGTLLFEEADASNGDRPEIDRTALRAILLESLPAGTVRWGRKVTGVAPLPDGRYEVACADGSAEAFDLVVGADGAWSRVRPLVSSAVPAYGGVSMVEIGLDDVDVKSPAIARLVGHGTMFALGDAKGMIAQRNGHAHVRVYLAFRVDQDWLARGVIDLSTPDRARATLSAQFDGWSPALLALIAQAGDRIAARAIHALPVGHSWESRPGLTLLGDAAHVMSPFSGEGVNNAMLDAADLALRLSAGGDWRDAVRAYETTMFARAAEAAAGAAEGMESAISHAAPKSVLEHLIERRDQAQASSKTA